MRSINKGKSRGNRACPIEENVAKISSILFSVVGVRNVNVGSGLAPKVSLLGIILRKNSATILEPKVTK